MTDSSENRTVVLGMLDEQIDALVSLASKSDPKAAQSHLIRIRYLLGQLGAGNTGKYSKHKSVVNAILDYLDEVRRPVSRASIVDALTAGGFRGGGGDTKPAILKSIGSYVGGRGLLTGQLKEIDGLVGKGEWASDGSWDERKFSL